MTDIMQNFFAIIMCFYMLVVAPASLDARNEDATVRRTLDNEIALFIDNVSDSGYLDHKSLEDFYLACSSTGVNVDVKVERLVKVVSPDGKGKTYTSYVQSDNITADWNKGDRIRVNCKIVSYSGIHYFLSYLSGYSPIDYDKSYTKRVRI